MKLRLIHVYLAIACLDWASCKRDDRSDAAALAKDIDRSKMAESKDVNQILSAFAEDAAKRRLSESASKGYVTALYATLHSTFHSESPRIGEIRMSREKLFAVLPHIVNFIGTPQTQEAWFVLTCVQTDCPPPKRDAWRDWLESKRKINDVPWFFPDDK